jgi:short-subunit dehydrogenase
MKNLITQYGNLALITGASSGIGEQFAHLLARKGFDLLLTARSANALVQLASDLSVAHDVNVDIFLCDLSKCEQLDALITYAQQKDLGLIVSNAGFGAKGDFLAHDYAQVEAMYQTNSIAPSKLAHALLPQLVKKQRGGMIFTGSIEGDVPFPYSAPYAASKAFLHSLVSSLWFEMKPHNVDILLLAPGSTDTQAPIKQGMTRKQLIGLLPPKIVAEQALKQLGKTMSFTPGLVNRCFIGLLKVLPRNLATRFAGMGMKKAIEDAKKSRSTT